VWGRGGIAPPLLTSALDGGEWSASRSAVLHPGTHWIGGWVCTEPVWMLWSKEKSLTLPRNRSLIVQPVARRYTNWAIPEVDISACSVRSELELTAYFMTGRSNSPERSWVLHASSRELRKGQAGDGLGKSDLVVTCGGVKRSFQLFFDNLNILQEYNQ
jgi:hypothetical protein